MIATSWRKKTLQPEQQHALAAGFWQAGEAQDLHIYSQYKLQGKWKKKNKAEKEKTHNTHITTVSQLNQELEEQERINKFKKKKSLKG